VYEKYKEWESERSNYNTGEEEKRTKSPPFYVLSLPDERSERVRKVVAQSPSSS
jgi:hypothetical protein